MKQRIATLGIVLLLTAGAAVATEVGLARADHRGDRIEGRLDRRGRAERG